MKSEVLKTVAYKLRENCLKMTTQAGSGHPTSCLSAADIMATLFFYAMKFDLHHFDNPNNDRFILSKGHAAPLLYAVYKELGLLTEDELMKYRTIDSPLEGHPTYRFSYAQAATGSLGQGLSIAAGIAMMGKIDQRDFKTYCLMGDSEITEGSVWEAVEIAEFYKLNNLIAILDLNRLGQSTETVDGHHEQRYADKFKGFGWHAFCVDGHNVEQLMHVFDQVRERKDRPHIIIAKTIKGYGVDQAADKLGFHGKAFSKEELPSILQAMQHTFKIKEISVNYQPNLPKNEKLASFHKYILEPHAYKIGEKIATRKAYGHALEKAGHTVDQLIVLDAEVKNSTFAEIFEKSFPQRFIQCFVAEQNMVGMAVGLQKQHKIPFASTFGVFFTRAFDQIRMAALSKAAVRLAGSHAGVSIGQDGPSQMALEDITMMRTIPESIILYPCDAPSTYACVQLMLNEHQKISYLRLTRTDTPVIYQHETFQIGGCHVIHQSDRDQACIVAAGITLHEALKAYEKLKKKNISVSIIDLYSIKPFDRETVLETVKKSNNTMIVVEDHYLEGGIGQMIASSFINESLTITLLAVKQLPRSGKPEELLAWAGIDAQAIEKAVYKFNN